MSSILLNTFLAPIHKCWPGTGMDTPHSEAKWVWHQNCLDYGSPNEQRCNEDTFRSCGWTHGKWKSWRILIWPCFLFMGREWRSVPVTIALVFISKASVFKMKIKKWHCLFIISYQFYLAFYGVYKLCFGFDVIYKSMIKMLSSVYFILSSMIRWHPWIEKQYSLINSPVFSITALEKWVVSKQWSKSFRRVSFLGKWERNLWSLQSLLSADYFYTAALPPTEFHSQDLPFVSYSPLCIYLPCLYWQHRARSPPPGANSTSVGWISSWGHPTQCSQHLFRQHSACKGLWYCGCLCLLVGLEVGQAPGKR